jgi:hypothetical protein
MFPIGDSHVRVRPPKDLRRGRSRVEPLEDHAQQDVVRHVRPKSSRARMKVAEWTVAAMFPLAKCRIMPGVALWR